MVAIHGHRDLIVPLIALLTARTLTLPRHLKQHLRFFVRKIIIIVADSFDERRVVVRQCNRVLTGGHVAQSRGRISLQYWILAHLSSLLVVVVGAALAVVASAAVTLLKVNLLGVALKVLVI